MQIHNQALLRSTVFLGGNWLAADSGATLAVRDPASGAVLAAVPNCGTNETRRAIAAADAALPAWREQTARQRAKVLQRWLALINANADDLAQLITAECGKPLVEAKGEVTYGASFVEWFAEESKRAYGDTIPTPAADRRLVVVKQAIGGALTASPVVRKLSFTGSTEVGRLLMAQCAPTIKKLSLELGGNAPFIVFDDADVDAAVDGALVAKYRNTGQTCVCANRILVQAGVYEEFAQKLAARAGQLKVGAGLEEGVAQGPLIDAAGLAKVETQVADALAKGARVLCGGARHERGGNFYQPTVLADVTPAMRVAREETFGPVAPLFRFASEAEAVAMANDTEFGLAAYFYTRDVARCWRVGEALEYGMVGINTGLISNEVAPFGGIKQSGLGREGSKYGIEDYLEIKYLCFDVNG